MLQSFPIYIKAGSLTDESCDKLSEITGRPIVEIIGSPKDCVLDVCEELRDKLAGQALIGILSSGAHFASDYKRVAQLAYNNADEMLKQRGNNNG